MAADWSQGLSALGAGLDSLTGSLQQYQKRTGLAALGEDLANNDYATAAKKAFALGDLPTGISILKMGQDANSDATAMRLAGIGQLPAASSPATAPAGGASASPVGGFDNAVNRTLGFEGGLNTRDTNGTPSNFGVNAKANPDVDVANLTPDAAKGIYKQRYWNAIGADNLPPALAHVAFDTAVIAGVGKANELLHASGADPAKFLALRDNFLGNLLRSNPDKYGPYAKAWANRSAGLRADIGLPSGGAPVQVASNDPGFVPQGGARAYAPGGQPAAAEPTISDDDYAGPQIGSSAIASVANVRPSPAASGPSPNDTDRAKLLTKQSNLTQALYFAKTDGAKATIKAQLDQVGQQLKDSKDRYDIRVVGDGMIAINKDDPSQPPIQINTGVRPQSQAEYDQRKVIADDQGLTGDERKQFLLNGKVPDATHVLKPGDVLAGPQGATLAKNEGDPNATMDDRAIDFVIDRMASGDPRALVGIGRGAQQANNLGRIYQRAAERGINADDLVKAQSEYFGRNAESRTLGTQEARATSFATEAAGALNLAREASNGLPRTNSPLVNSAIQAYQDQTGDPRLSKFGAALLTFGNTYAKAINPNGTPHDRDKAELSVIGRLKTVTGPDALNAVFDQLGAEIEMARRSPAAARLILDNIRAGRDPTQGIDPRFLTSPGAQQGGSIPVSPSGVPQTQPPVRQPLPSLERNIGPKEVRTSSFGSRVVGPGATQPGMQPASAPQQAAAPQQLAPQADVSQARQAPDGNWYVPDPARPGKFLQVVH